MLNLAAPLPPQPRVIKNVRVLAWVCVQCDYEHESMFHLVCHAQVTGHRQVSMRCEETP